jgi:hypothetical protein
LWSDHAVTHDIIPTSITLLPRPPDGWFDYGYAVLWNGELALLRTDRDIHSALARWYDATRQGVDQDAQPDLTGARLRLSVFDGEKESAGIEVPVGRWALVDRLADGRWLVVSDPLEPASNIDARLYKPDGTPAGAFAIGNYVTRVQCAADSTIWAGYFDASVLNGDTTISSAGIARFDADGRLLWRFDDQEGRRLPVEDCYTLTLEGATLWSCFNPGFPIVRIAQGVVRYWRHNIDDADALAVDGDHVLLVGAHGEHRSRLALLRLDGDDARQVGMWAFRRPDLNTAQLMQGRGATLHIIGDGKWRRISVASLLEGRVYH